MIHCVVSSNLLNFVRHCNMRTGIIYSIRFTKGFHFNAYKLHGKTTQHWNTIFLQLDFVKILLLFFFFFFFTGVFYWTVFLSVNSSLFVTLFWRYHIIGGYYNYLNNCQLALPFGQQFYTKSKDWTFKHIYFEGQHHSSNFAEIYTHILIYCIVYYSISYKWDGQNITDTSQYNIIQHHKMPPPKLC